VCVRKGRSERQLERLAWLYSDQTSTLVAQMIDDINGVTIVAASTHEKGLASVQQATWKLQRRSAKLSLQRAKEKGVDKVAVFDRGGYQVSRTCSCNVADAAREAGIKF
jgi:large subunit ribosomal protein L18